MPKKDEYETVNEGMTTDTTEAPSLQAKRTSPLTDEPESQA